MGPDRQAATRGEADAVWFLLKAVIATLPPAECARKVEWVRAKAVNVEEDAASADTDAARDYRDGFLRRVAEVEDYVRPLLDEAGITR